MASEEAVFGRFAAYAWNRDTRFLMGLASMQAAWESERLTPTQLDARIEQAQAFYFSRCRRMRVPGVH